MMTESSIGFARPVDVLEDLVLFVPDRRDMCVRQKDQADVTKNSFRKIHDDIASGIPRQEYAGLGAAQRIDCAFQKADTRVPPSRVWENLKTVVHILLCGREFHLGRYSPDLILGQSAHLGGL